VMLAVFIAFETTSLSQSGSSIASSLLPTIIGLTKLVDLRPLDTSLHLQYTCAIYKRGAAWLFRQSLQTTGLKLCGCPLNYACLKPSKK
jgi:hypothetical protein